jgi:dihydrofolate synthase/folylpolyglutamate synthase
MEFFDYSAALRFLESRINYEATRNLPYRSQCFKLKRMEDLLQQVGSPHKGLKVVHIAGTKGKGSTAVMVSSILREAGYRVGCFTSPHLETVLERLTKDGEMCSEEEFAELIYRLIPAVEQVDRRAPTGGYLHGPTYFEIVTAAAFLWFAQHQVDFAVLEVGLGGRLDATNVCSPAVAAITSISMDHMEQLGYSLASIAREKAGIIKPGIPTVSGVPAGEAREVIEAVCTQTGSPLRQLGRDFWYVLHKPSENDAEKYPGNTRFLGPTFDFVRVGDWVTRKGSKPFGHKKSMAGGSSVEWVLEKLQVPLLGQHQAANAAVAVAIAAELAGQGWAIDDQAIRRGLLNVRWPARLEVLHPRPLVILDGAHNGASMEAGVRTIRECFGPRPLWVLFGTSRDKDFRAMLEILLSESELLTFTQYSSTGRAMAADDLFASACELGAKEKKLWVNPEPVAAWRALLPQVPPHGILLVTGSLFLAGRLRKIMIQDLVEYSMGPPRAE